MIISVPKETNLNETRVAATPQSVKELIKAGYKVKIQTGAGSKSFISDAAYKEVGANIIEVDAETKAKAARKAMLFSRTNTFLSIPMLVAMTVAQNSFS